MSSTAKIVYTFHLTSHHANFGQFTAKLFRWKFLFIQLHVLLESAIIIQDPDSIFGSAQNNTDRIHP